MICFLTLFIAGILIAQLSTSLKLILVHKTSGFCKTYMIYGTLAANPASGYRSNDKNDPLELFGCSRIKVRLDKDMNEDQAEHFVLDEAEPSEIYEIEEPDASVDVGLRTILMGTSIGCKDRQNNEWLGQDR
jgi:hypothetical protein